jgi:hypothetical protein
MHKHKKIHLIIYMVEISLSVRYHKNLKNEMCLKSVTLNKIADLQGQISHH